MTVSQQLPLFKQLKQRIEEPLPQTEDSILLRVLVQALVIVGTVATDVAAGTQVSFWAVPSSLVGATWSWYRRRRRNVALKFVLALGMIVALLAFLGNLLSSLNDTRLVLAQLLIQLQVLHSFDLPRRKDLGYSTIIGLILMAVAGTVSQTSVFAVFLLLFLAISLPTLVLDYRSRLGLTPVVRNGSQPARSEKKRLGCRYSPLSPQRLGLLLALVALMGLAIFALLPRFPSYQFQTFPVGGGAELEEQVFNPENRGITNPGYVQEGQQNQAGGGGSTGAPTEGAGNVDSTYYYGFNSKINQNLRGVLERKLVMRVRSQAPGFWRVLAFDRYTGQGWESREDQQIDIQRPSWTYRFTLTPLPRTGRTKRVIQTYTAVSDLPNLIPALSYPKHLYFPTREIALDPEGSIRAPVGLIEGLTYTVISEVPYRDRTLLRTASQNYPASLKTHYLQIPPEIASRVRQQAEALLAKSPQPLDSAYEKALYLTQALKQNYNIQPELPFFEEDEDLVEAFLFRYQGGYPDHFASTLTIMLRSLGIPARLSVGFSSGQFNPFTGYYLVHNTDAHALTEVYFPEYGWFTFDPIPGHEIVPPSVEESQAFGVLRQFWKWVSGWLPSPLAGLLSWFWEQIVGRLVRLLGWLWRFVSGSLMGLLTGLIGAIALSFLGWLGWRGRQNWQERCQLNKLPPMERLYQQMLGRLKTAGYPKHPAQTPLEYALIAHQYYPLYSAKIITEISQAYVDWRYGDKAPDLNDLRKQLKELHRYCQRNFR